MDWLPVTAVVLLAMCFTYTNGFHDAPNSVATSIATRTLAPRAALAMAAVANLVGAFFGARVAQTVGQGVITAPVGDDGLRVCAAALVGAIAWNLLTWWRGMPSSSSHALIGGLVGAALTLGGAGVRWDGVLTKVVLPGVISPLVGLLLGYVLVRLLSRAFHGAPPARVNRGVRVAQTGSAAAVAFGHGMQDAAKTAGVVVLALTVGGYGGVDDGQTPLWVLATCAVVISLGTLAGGWRIMRTLGRRIVEPTPTQGLAAEAGTALVLYVATALHAPVSSTHTIAGAVVGAGTARRVRAVRWGVASSIAVTWALTLPAAGLLAAGVAVVLRAL